MAWRTLYITKASSLSCKDNQLVYKTDITDPIKIPIEDISVLMIESLYVNLTSTLLSKLIDNNVCIFICNNKHIPNGVLIPFLGDARATEVAYLQQAMSEPLKKRIWQSTIVNKIYNQSLVIKNLGDEDTAKVLLNYSQQVKLGDEGNIEGISAKIYWAKLFNKQITRKSESKINSLLNYGYTIIRGVIARDLVSAGFIPCFGIHHCNKLNSYNLADDIVEPFRPILDNYIFSKLDIFNFTNIDISPEEKAIILGVLDANCIFKKEHIKILNASNLTISLLSSAIKNYNYKLLLYPSL